MTKRRGLITAITVMVAVFALVWGNRVQAQEDQVTYTFRVTVNGTPCENATYWAVIGIPESEGYTVQLTDPDGDRVYTGSEQLVAGNDVFLSLQQGVGSVESPTTTTPFPGPPVVTLRDLGRITVQQDTLVEATAPACQPGLPGTGATDQLPFALLIGSVLAVATGVYLKRSSKQMI